LASDGSLVFSDGVTRGYRHRFAIADWSENGELVIPFSRHRVSKDDNLIANVRDIAGNEVACNVRVSDDGTLTQSKARRYSPRFFHHSSV
jgi:hypothetical protein